MWTSLDRQGDVLLRRVAPVDLSAAAAKADKAVAYGEHSGHAHVATGDAEVVEIAGRLYVVVGADGGQLEHLHLPTGRRADHLPLVLEQGYYEVLLQNQYNPLAKAMERVLD